MKTLFEEVRSEQNLFSAWRHVKRSALSSSNDEIKGFAAEFEHQHQRHLKRIARQLREETFRFDEVKGVLKDKRQREKAGKDPRPIAIATLKNRVVQRAILQVLQPRKALDERDINTKFEPIEDPRLGLLNQVNRSRFGVGGLMRPFGGVRPAIKLIMDAMAEGGGYYYQSDIKAFFTKIPTADIVAKVRSETRDEKMAGLFEKGLEVNLYNKDELLTYAKLFPSNGTGVAQGSSLSAFAGNVLLFDFDHQLNKMGVTAVRYIDDLLIVSSSEQLLDQAIAFSENHLSSFGFSLYQTVTGSDKASRGECKTGFNFLGCTVQTNRCVPSPASRKKVSADVSETISASKRGINELIQQGKPLNPKYSRSATLYTLGKKIFGWQKSFAFCTDAHAFKLVDADVAGKVRDYEQWVQRKTGGLPNDKLMPILGIPTTEQLFRADVAERKNREERSRPTQPHPSPSSWDPNGTPNALDFRTPAPRQT